MPNLQFYLERIAGKSPTKFGFSRHGPGKSRYTYLLGNDGTNTYPDIQSPHQIHAAAVEFIGKTETNEDFANLFRTLPKADPFNPFLFCDDIAETKGLGRPTLCNTYQFLDQVLEADPMETFELYPCYEFDISFTPKPYAHISDYYIQRYEDPSLPDAALGALPNQIRYYYPDGGRAGPDGDLFLYAAEWLRYTDIETTPTVDFITAQAGQFVIDVASAAAPDNVQAANGQLRMRVPKQGIKINWYEVPYSYVEVGNLIRPSPNSLGDDVPMDSFIMEALGCVNQWPWCLNGKWYPEGTLLLESVGVMRYQPPVPSVSTWAGVQGVFAAQKLCDITFMFIYFNPGLGYDAGFPKGHPVIPPALAEPLIPSNKNTVTNGHNLVPYAHMMDWYYAKTKVQNFTGASNRPIYPSFPMQLIFSNPLASQPE